MLTLIVDTNVDTTRKITKLNSADAGVGGCSNIHFVKISCKPAFTLSVAVLSENVFPVKVVHANLPIHPSGRVPGIRGPTHLFPVPPVDRSQRGERDSADDGQTMKVGPSVV